MAPRCARETTTLPTPPSIVGGGSKGRNERRAAATRAAFAQMLAIFLVIATFASSYLIPEAMADVRINSLAKLGFSDKQLEKQPTLKYKNAPGNGKGGRAKVLREDVEVYPYQVPSNFNYAKLKAREKNNNDRSLRDNIDNEANQRRVASEQPKDMTPCRQDEGRPRQALKVSAGDDLDIPLQFNNPHDGEAEINLWKNAGTDKAQVATIARFDAGGGYSQNRPSVKVPEDAPECKPEDKCLMQFYWHTVEPRTYAICTDVEIAAKGGGAGQQQQQPQKRSDEVGDNVKRLLRYDDNNAIDKSHEPFSVATGSGGAAAAANDGDKNDGNNNSGGGGGAAGASTNPGSSLKQYPVQFKDPIYYSDSFHTAHVDSTHSGYQGQDPDNVSDNMKARIYLNESTTAGGLLKDALPKKTLQARKQARNQVNNAIKGAEKNAIRSNKKAQLSMLKGKAALALTSNAAAGGGNAAGKGELPGFESDRYSDVLNPRRRRQYTNTYVTNVDTQKIADNFRPEFEAKGLTTQSVAVKDTYKNTEVYGMKNNNLKTNKGAINELPDSYKKALGSTSQKLLKVRSLGGDEEAELAEDIAKHESPITIPQKLIDEREYKDPSTLPGGEGSGFLTDAEKSALSAAVGGEGDDAAAVADLGSGDSALDQNANDEVDPGDNPDDANADGADTAEDQNAE